MNDSLTSVLDRVPSDIWQPLLEERNKQKEEEETGAELDADGRGGGEGGEEIEDGESEDSRMSGEERGAGRFGARGLGGSEETFTEEDSDDSGFQQPLQLQLQQRGQQPLQSPRHQHSRSGGVTVEDEGDDGSMATPQPAGRRY